MNEKTKDNELNQENTSKVNGGMIFTRICRECNGKGEKEDGSKCPACGGAGFFFDM